MTDKAFYKDHWVNIDPARLARYQRMFQWNPDSTALYEAADIRPGQVIGDFGAGPGHSAVEFAKWVGHKGHVHAFDINPDFVAQTRDNAQSAGLAENVTAHLCDGSSLPLPDEALDRLTTRNTLIYVDDPDTTLREFRRVLKPGGKLHAIEGDWPMMVVEPVRATDWAALVAAASHACRTPDIGRKLHGLMRRSGFADIQVQVITRPDSEGRLLPMIKNMAGYARDGGTMTAADLDDLLATIDQAIAAGTYLALAPQFVVTATC